MYLCAKPCDLGPELMSVCPWPPQPGRAAVIPVSICWDHVCMPLSSCIVTSLRRRLRLAFLCISHSIRMHLSLATLNEKNSFADSGDSYPHHLCARPFHIGLATSLKGGYCPHFTGKEIGTKKGFSHFLGVAGQAVVTAGI